MPLATAGAAPVSPTCAEIAASPPSGTFTEDGTSFLTASGAEAAADVIATEVVVPTKEGGATVERRWFLLTFSTAANECAYRRAALRRRGVTWSVVGVRSELDAAATEPFGAGSYEVAAGGVFDPLCPDTGVVDPDGLGANSTGTITITARTDTMVEGSYVLFAKGTSVVSKGTFRAPLCAEPARTTVTCCE